MKNRNPMGVAVLLSFSSIVLLLLFFNGIGFTGKNFFISPNKIIRVQSRINRSENNLHVKLQPDARRVNFRKSKNYRTIYTKTANFNVFAPDVFLSKSTDMGSNHIVLSNSMNFPFGSFKRKLKPSVNSAAYQSVSLNSIPGLSASRSGIYNSIITKTDILAMQKTSLPTGPSDPGTGSLPDSPLDPGTGSLPDTPLDPYGASLNNSYLYLLIFAGIYISFKFLINRKSDQKSLYHD